MEAEKFQSASQSLEKQLAEMEKKNKNLQRANHMLKREKDKKDKLIEGLTKKKQEEKSQLIEDQRNKINHHRHFPFSCSGGRGEN